MWHTSSSWVRESVCGTVNLSRVRRGGGCAHTHMRRSSERVSPPVSEVYQVLPSSSQNPFVMHPRYGGGGGCHRGDDGIWQSVADTFHDTRTGCRATVQNDGNTQKQHREIHTQHRTDTSSKAKKYAVGKNAKISRVENSAQITRNSLSFSSHTHLYKCELMSCSVQKNAPDTRRGTDDRRRRVDSSG